MRLKAGRICRRFSRSGVCFQMDIGKLLDETRTMPLVVLDGMEIHVPPRGERKRSKAGMRRRK